MTKFFTIAYPIEVIVLLIFLGRLGASADILVTWAAGLSIPFAISLCYVVGAEKRKRERRRRARRTTRDYTRRQGEVA